jgi:hypothetical protein
VSLPLDYTAKTQYVVGFLVYLAITLYRNWRCIRVAGLSSQLDVWIHLRVLLFGVYLVFVMAFVQFLDFWSLQSYVFLVSLYILFGPGMATLWTFLLPLVSHQGTSHTLYLTMFSLVGAAIVLIFGTQAVCSNFSFAVCSS